MSDDDKQAYASAKVGQAFTAFREAKRLATRSLAFSDRHRAVVREILDRHQAWPNKNFIDPCVGLDDEPIPRLDIESGVIGAVIAVYAADVSDAHLIRGGYTIEKIEATRPLSATERPGGTRPVCDWRLEDCEEFAIRYERVAVGQFLILLRSCIPCIDALPVVTVVASNE